MRFFTSDTHFFHENILRLCPEKRKEGFEEFILNNFAAVLSHSSTLYHLGDFLWEEREGFLEAWRALPGRKVLVLGNHDRKPSRLSRLDLYFDEIYDSPLTVEVKGKKVLLYHFPSKDLRTYRFRGLQRFITRKYFEEGASLLLHGHVHYNVFGVFCGCHLNGVKCLNVNVEFTGFKPVSEEELPLW